MSNSSDVVRIRAGVGPLYPLYPSTRVRTAGESPTGEAQNLDLPAAVQTWLATLEESVVKGIMKVLRAGSVPAVDANRRAASALTSRERAKCKAKGIDPAKYAANKATMFGGKK